MMHGISTKKMHLGLLLKYYDSFIFRYLLNWMNPKYLGFLKKLPVLDMSGHELKMKQLDMILIMVWSTHQQFPDHFQDINCLAQIILLEHQLWLNGLWKIKLQMHVVPKSTNVWLNDVQILGFWYFAYQLIQNTQ